jgi:endonuclease/exonuclease/phosphatase family metal-dependent hydrolase
MKILQLNIWGGKLGKQIVELLERERPDIVCFQEAIELPGNENFFFASLGEILSKTNFEYTFFSPSFAFWLMNRKLEWGNVILSHVPFVATDVVFTRGEFTDDFDLLENDYNMRNLQRATILHNKTPLHILNHHGHHVKQHKMGDEETMRQCKMIADYIGELEGEVVLCGDFNLAPHSESLEQLNALLVNHCIEAEVRTTRTQLTHKTEVCDYIFTSKNLSTKSFRVLPDIASDHSALVIEID